MFDHCRARREETLKFEYKMDETFWYLNDDQRFFRIISKLISSIIIPNLLYCSIENVCNSGG